MTIIASDKAINAQIDLAYNANLPSRKVFQTPGGVHPAENKSQSVQKPIEQAPIPAQLTHPLSQHIGAAAKPIVNVGDKVLTGQKIAEADGFVSVPVHAASSGTVIAIEDRPIAHASGFQAPCIVIETDGEDNWITHQGVDDYTQLERSELLALIRDAGIAGMGGAGFPTAVKLQTRDDQTINSLIINGTECEPYITADDILMRERAEQIVQGALILKYLINPREEAIIGVEDNKPEAIQALRKAAEGTAIEIVSFPTKYPSGGEKQLIQILTGKEVPSGGLPSDIGIVCQNIGSTVAIYRAVVFGEPLISRVTTVTGYACERQQNFEVRLGSPMRLLLEACGYQAEKASRLIMGGPMMGFALPSLDLPIVKTTNCLLAPTADELAPETPAQACIRCGMCAEACPASLLPQQMYWYARSKNHEGLLAHNLMDCIECGACSYACPSNIPLVQYYRASKADIRRADAEAKKAEYSMGRYEARIARLEQVEAEKAAKRQARQAKAAAAASAKEAQARDQQNADATTVTASSSAVNDDPVAAAIARAKAKAEGAPVDAAAEAKSKLASLESRLQKAEQKLQSAKDSNDDNLQAFQASVDKLQEKVDAARQAVEATNSKPSASASVKQTPANDDPVAAAIARAQAKAAGTTIDPVAEAEAKLSGLKKRLAKAEQKLQHAQASNDDNIAAFEASVNKLQDKIAEAQQLLDQSAPTSSPSSAPTNSAQTIKDDPVAAAIARAKAKAEGQSDPIADAEAAVSSLNKRLQKAETKLAQAEQDQDDNLPAFAASVEKLQQKLAQANKRLEELRPRNDLSQAGESTAEPESTDPVAAAIAKAQAKRAGTGDSLSPKEKLEQDLAAIEKRIDNANSKLAQAEQGSDKANAIAASLEKLKQKQADAQQALETL